MLAILLSAIIILQTVFHYIERRDMCNRLMSRNFSEYKQGTPPPLHIPSAHDRVLKKWRDKAGDK